MSGAQTQDRRSQRLAALERANGVKAARLELRRKLERGEIFAASLLLEPTAEVRNWAVGDLIQRQRSWGPVRCRKLLARLTIPATKPIAELTERQRRELVQALGGVRRE